MCLFVFPDLYPCSKQLIRGRLPSADSFLRIVDEAPNRQSQRTNATPDKLEGFEGHSLASVFAVVRTFGR
jgi:hypothetical protein